MNEQTVIPTGWEAVSLGDVVAPSTQKAEPSEFGDSIYIGLENIESGTNRIIATGDVDSVKSTKAVFRAGDVLYGKLRPYLNKVCRPPFNGVCSTDILVFPQIPFLDSGYLLHFLSSPKTIDFANQNASGINLPRIGASALSEIDFPLPPLPEQRRIVAKIEALQERSRKAREALEEVGPLLEQFRQSLLAAAFRGDLTADWRAANPNVEPASELLNRIRQERRQKWEQTELANYEAKGKQPPKGWQDKYEEPEPIDDSVLDHLPHGWCWATFDTFIEFVTSGSRGWAKYYSKTGPLFVRSQNINTDTLILEDVAHVSPPSGSEGIRTRILKFDLLITITGANVAKAAFVNIPIDEAYVSQHVALARPVDPALSPYLHLWTVSPENGRAQLLAHAYGNGKPGLNLDNLKQMKVAVAPPREQVAILEIIQNSMSGIEAISAAVSSSNDELTQLDQSILAKAFRGELVPQDPNDEPASVMLERIRKSREREKQWPKKKDKKQSVTMSGTLKDRLTKWIEETDIPSFSLNQIAKDIAIDYDELKEAFFQMLDSEAILEQYFDNEAKSIRFRKVR